MKPRLISYWLVTVAAVALVSPLRGALVTSAPLLNDPVAGQNLAAELRSLRPQTGSEFRGTLKLRQRDGSVRAWPLTSKIILSNQVWSTLYEVQTASNRTEVLEVVHHRHTTNEYRQITRDGVAGAPLVLAPLPSSNLWQPFAESDFFPADLGLEFFHWPTQILVVNEMRKNRSCHVLDSRPAVANGYSRVRSWVDVETGGVLMAEAYDSSDKRVKEFEVKSFKKSGDQWQLQEMEIRDLKRRTRTILEFEVPDK